VGTAVACGGALALWLKAAPLSKRAVSRVVGTLKVELEAWRTRSPAELRAASVPRQEGRQRARSQRGRYPYRRPEAAHGVGTVRRRIVRRLQGGAQTISSPGVLGAPVICVTDGHTGLRKAVELVWPKASIQRCAVYAESLAATRSSIGAFERKWRARCPGVVRSLQEGGDELLTFFQPKSQWKTLRTTDESVKGGSRSETGPLCARRGSHCRVAAWADDDSRHKPMSAALQIGRKPGAVRLAAGRWGTP